MVNDGMMLMLIILDDYDGDGDEMMMIKVDDNGVDIHD